MWKGQDFPVRALFGVAISLAIFGWDCAHCRVIGFENTGVVIRLCLSHQIYHPPTQACYTRGNRRGPCARGSWFRQSAENPNIGECRCRMGPCRDIDGRVGGDESTGALMKRQIQLEMLSQTTETTLRAPLRQIFEASANFSPLNKCPSGHVPDSYGGCEIQSFF